MQLYRGMDIGTAKLSVAERRGIPHHLFDAREVTQDAAVAWYQPLAREAVRQIHAAGGDAILVGGSGLYVSSVVYEFHFPPRDPAIRERLEQELDREGVGSLLQRLRERDPEAAARVDPRNGRRVIRALEIIEQGSETHGAVLPETPTLWYPHTRLIGLHVDRGELVARLDARVRRMWEQGLVAEVAGLRDRGAHAALRPSAGVVVQALPGAGVGDATRGRRRPAAGLTAMSVARASMRVWPLTTSPRRAWTASSRLPSTPWTGC
ncbi:unnamed protein product [Penicillium discolor]